MLRISDHRDAGIEPAQKESFQALLALLTIANFWGVFNVVTHQDTTKNSWNLPVRHVMEVLPAQRTSCQGDLVVLSHDLTLYCNLERAGYSLIDPYSRKMLPDQLFILATNA